MRSICICLAAMDVCLAAVDFRTGHTVAGIVLLALAVLLVSTSRNV